MKRIPVAYWANRLRPFAKFATTGLIPLVGGVDGSAKSKGVQKSQNRKDFYSYYSYALVKFQAETSLSFERLSKMIAPESMDGSPLYLRP